MMSPSDKKRYERLRAEAEGVQSALVNEQQRNLEITREVAELRSKLMHAHANLALFRSELERYRRSTAWYDHHPVLALAHTRAIDALRHFRGK